MKRANDRKHNEPTHRAINPHRHAKPTAKTKSAKPAPKTDRSSFINISQEQKHGRGPRR